MARGQRAKPSESSTSANGKSASQRSGLSLRDEVRDVLLAILKDTSSGATARASAGRTLWEMYKDDAGVIGAVTPAAEMSESDIDAEIARLEKRQQK